MHWSSRLAILYLLVCLAAMLPVPLRSGKAEARWQTVQGMTLPGSLLVTSFPPLSQQGDTLLAVVYATLAATNALAICAGLRGASRLISWLEHLDDADRPGKEPRP
jgi:hypothetical protein